MNAKTGNRGLIIGIAVLGVLCAGAVCLAGGVPAGALAVRQAIDLRKTDKIQGAKTSASGTIEATGVEDTTSTPGGPTMGNQYPIPKSSEMPFQMPATPSGKALIEGEGTPTGTLPIALTAPAPTGTPPLAGSAVVPTGIPGTGASDSARSLDAWCAPWNSPTKRADVLKVIDGVTIEARVDGKSQKIRYIGIDLLEFGEDAKTWSAMREKNRSLVEGKNVILIESAPGGDIGADDGPLLRYVLLDNSFVNLEMVKSGYAVAKSTPPHTGCDATFEQAETEAIVEGRGLWAPASTPTRTLRPPTATVSAIGEVVVVKVAYRGTIWQEPEEYVEIFNSGIEAVQLEGWSVSDIQNHIFVFPNFVLGPGEYCRVTTNEYRPQNCGFSYYRLSPIWDNTGDCAYLKDLNGRLVDEFCYD